MTTSSALLTRLERAVVAAWMLNVDDAQPQVLWPSVALRFSSAERVLVQGAYLRLFPLLLKPGTRRSLELRLEPPLS